MAYQGFNELYPKFKKWYESIDPEQMKLPEDWRKLTGFQSNLLSVYMAAYNHGWEDSEKVRSSDGG